MAEAGPMLVPYLLLLLGLARSASNMGMITKPAHLTLKVGDSLVLNCDFRTIYFNLFDNPIIWRKVQRNESTQVNIQGNINKPFIEHHRFRVSFNQMPPLYRFVLEINPVTREDNGNYTCEVRGATSTILANVTHSVTVKAPVTELYIATWNTTNAPTDRLREMEFTEGVHGTFRCVAHGGYPVPDMQITVGDHDIGSAMTLAYDPVFMGPKGLRSMAVTVERWTTDFLARPEYDGRNALCTAVVPGMPANSTAVRLKVNYSPQVRCPRVFAYEGQRNKSVTCTVTSRPRATDVRWLMKTKDDETFDIISSTAYEAVQRPTGETTLSITLIINHVGRRRFGPYVISARNAVKVTRVTVELEKIPKPTTPSPMASSSAHKPPYAGSSGGQQYIYIIAGGGMTTQQSSHLFTISLALIVGLHLSSNPAHR